MDAAGVVALAVEIHGAGKVARPVGVAWIPHGSRDDVVGTVRAAWVVTVSVGCALSCSAAWVVGNAVGIDVNGANVGCGDGCTVDVGNGLGNTVGLGVGVELAGGLDGACDGGDALGNDELGEHVTPQHVPSQLFLMKASLQHSPLAKAAAHTA